MTPLGFASYRSPVALPEMVAELPTRMFPVVVANAVVPEKVGLRLRVRDPAIVIDPPLALNRHAARPVTVQPEPMLRLPSPPAKK